MSLNDSNLPKHHNDQIVKSIEVASGADKAFSLRRGRTYSHKFIIILVYPWIQFVVRCYKMKLGMAWWCTPITPGLWEAEAG